MKYEISVHGEVFVVDQQDRDGLMGAIQRGHDFYELKDGSLISTKIGYCREKPNEILRDQLFSRYAELKQKKDIQDAELREKMRLEKTLDVKYPYQHYAEEWEEANKQIVGIVKL